MNGVCKSLVWLLLCMAVSCVFALSQPLAAQAAPECFPACRSGYTCSQDRCVSSCNPACALGEVCSTAGNGSSTRSAETQYGSRLWLLGGFEL